MLVGLSTIVIALLAAWLVVRVARDPGPEGRDPAATVRRLFLYGLLYTTVILAAQGVIELTGELIESDRRSNTALAQAMSFLIIGLPVAGLLGRSIDRRLAARPEERMALAWTVYLNAILATAVVGFVIEGHAVLHAALSSDSERSFQISNIVAAVVWGGVWAGHWFGLRRRHGILGDLHLAIGTIVGLVPMVVGLGGVTYIGADILYDAVTDNPDTSQAEPGFGYFAALAVAGAVVWAWYWLNNYRRSPRTEIWYVTVVPVGALAGFVATIVGVAAAINDVGVWFLGNPDAATAVRHFDSIPALVGVVAAGAPCWLYHRWELGPDPDRGMAIRVYDYLLAFAALVASVVGITMLLVAVFDDGPGSVANTVVGGATTVAVAGPVWVWFWSRIGATVRADPGRETNSPVRRVYLFTLFGVGGLLVLISALALLFTTIEDVLDGTLSRRTLHDDRIGLAILLTVTGVAWYHYRIYRADRKTGERPPPTKPPEKAVHDRRVVLVASNHSRLARHLAETSGASVVHWHRTDHEEGPVDVVDLDRQLIDRADEDLLVILGADGPIVIPFVDDIKESEQ
ncbi:MAG: DUF5671 domain-containing protein [Acidimicrobiia bacterium]|nr:DUF5671 domain-containing protein [Acidimicrobiia bacterium]